MSDRNGFRRADLRAFELLGKSRTLLGQDYWLFLGITAVGILLGSLVPMGILLGRMMVGIHMAYAAKQRGEPVEFGLLFKGFDKFAQSLIATLIILFCSLIVMAPAIALYLFALFGLLHDGGEGHEALVILVALVFYAVVFLVSLIVGALFMFVYPLIADRDVSGLDAVKLSVQAALGNVWGVLRLSLVNGLLGLVGVFACFVGAFFVLPFSIGMIWLAYREVFPEELDAKAS